MYESNRASSGWVRNPTGTARRRNRRFIRSRERRPRPPPRVARLRPASTEPIRVTGIQRPRTPRRGSTRGREEEPNLRPERPVARPTPAARQRPRLPDGRGSCRIEEDPRAACCATSRFETRPRRRSAREWGTRASRRPRRPRGRAARRAAADGARRRERARSPRRRERHGGGGAPVVRSPDPVPGFFALPRRGARGQRLRAVTLR
jgi:hypothetical protein